MDDSNTKLSAPDADQRWLYVGSCTSGPRRGIYVCRFDGQQGTLTAARRVVDGISPFFLTAHPNGKVLYAVGDKGNAAPKETGTIRAFSIDTETGDLTFINKVSSGGNVPCYIAIDKPGRCALVTNYSTGNVATFPIRPDGRLSHNGMLIQHTGSSLHPSRQQGSHPHAIILDADNRYALAADLGTDQLRVYRFEDDGPTLVPQHRLAVRLAPGSGPRHLAFDPTGRFLYVINELANTMTAFAYEPQESRLTELQTLGTIPDDYSETSYASELQVHPNGRFLYASNRGHDSLAVFGIDPQTGMLTLVDIQSCGGCWPRCFCMDSTGHWLLVACERSDSIGVFAVDMENGTLRRTDGGITLPTPGGLWLSG